MFSAYIKLIAMAAAFVGGYFCPKAAEFNFLIRYLVIWMLFLVLLKAQIAFKSFRWTHLKLVIANVAMGLGSYAVLIAVGHRELALAAFFTGITPTATAAPVVMKMLNDNVEFTLTAFLATNLAIPILFPVLLPMVLPGPAEGTFVEALKSVGYVIGIPVAAAVVVRLLFHNAGKFSDFFGKWSFYIWIFAIFLIVANASQFVREQKRIPTDILLYIGLVSLVICIINFVLGYYLGGKKYAVAASQSLGQKNTTLTIYLALQNADPLTALGPTFYVLWHNSYNSYSLFRHSLKEADKK